MWCPDCPPSLDNLGEHAFASCILSPYSTDGSSVTDSPLRGNNIINTAANILTAGSFLPWTWIDGFQSKSQTHSSVSGKEEGQSRFSASGWSNQQMRNGSNCLRSRSVKVAERSQPGLSVVITDRPGSLTNVIHPLCSNGLWGLCWWPCTCCPASAAFPSPGRLGLWSPLGTHQPSHIGPKSSCTSSCGSPAFQSGG